MTSAAVTPAHLSQPAWERPGRAAKVGPGLRRVGIVGSGQAGETLAELCLRAGLELSGGKAGRRLTVAGDLSELADCMLVLECSGEDASAKRALIADLDDLLPDGALIATHTERISVTELAAAAERPQRVVGLHLPHQTGHRPLVEVVRGELTEAGAVDAVAAFVRQIGGQPVPCEDTPGLVVDRVLVPLLNDCVRVLEETGVAPEALDSALRASAGWSLGPCALLDRIGIDAHVAAAESLYAAYRDPRMAPPPRLVRMRRAGLLGRKTARGFYSY